MVLVDLVTLGWRLKMKIDKRTAQQIEHMHNYSEWQISSEKNTILKMLEVLSIPFKLNYDGEIEKQILIIVLDANEEAELKLMKNDQAENLRKVIQEIQANDSKKYQRNN